MSEITPDTVNSKSVLHLKNLAKKRKKETGCKSSEAHEFVALTLGFKNWNNVLRLAEINDSRLLSSFNEEVKTKTSNSDDSIENSLSEKIYEDILKSSAGLKAVHNQLNDLLEQTFSGALRRPTKIKTKSVEIVKKQDLKENLPEFASYNFFQLKPTTIYGSVVLEPPFIFQLLQLFFGGGDSLKTPSKRKDFTEIEARMIKRVVLAIFDNFKKSWNELNLKETEYLWNDTNPDEWLKSLNSDDEIGFVDLRIEIQGIPQSFTLKLTYHFQPNEVINYLRKQHPQTIAMILTHTMETKNANISFHGLEEEIRSDVLFRIATLGEVPPGVIEDLRDTISENPHFEIYDQLADSSGSERAIEILKLMDKSSQEKVFLFWRKENQAKLDFIESMRQKLQKN
jgi:flagellar motor switch protein FliM